MAQDQGDFIDIQPFHWEYTETNAIHIRMWGLDKNSNKHLVRFPGFPAFCQLLLPKMVGGRYFEWTELAMADLFNFLCFRLKNKGAQPFSYTPQQANELYYYQGEHYSQFVRLYFSTTRAMRECERLLRYPIEFRTRYTVYGTMKATVAETDIPVIRKMLTARDCKFSGWMRVKGYHPEPRINNPDDDEFIQDDDDVIVKDVFGNVIHKDEGEKFYHISTLLPEREWIGDWTQLSMTPKKECRDWTTAPKLLGFDIEAYSDNHRIFPDRWNINHVAFMISCVVQRAFDKSSRVRYAIVLGRSNEIPESRLENCHIIEVDKELDLIEEMGRLVREEDPDVVMGYNIFDFDYPYLNSRLELSKLAHEVWPRMGCIIEEPTYLHSMNWSSGGYGFNSINDLVMAGRISVDMYPVIKRSAKLIRYNLDTVAAHFLKRQKHDVSPTEMFLTYERQCEAEDEYQEALKTVGITSKDDQELFYRMMTDRFKVAQKALDLFAKELEDGKYIDQYQTDPNEKVTSEYNDPSKGPVYDRHGKLNWCSNKLWDILTQVATDAIASVGTLPPQCGTMTPPVLGKLQAGVFIMTRVTYYCLIDSDLCIDLFDQQNTWFSLVSMSEIAGVTVKDIFTRGQQVRTLSLLYDFAAKEGVVLTKREAPEIEFTGGFVFSVIPGVYDGVAVVDFNSLYPSIIIAYNICYTTLLRPEHFNELPEDDVYTVAVPRPDKDDDYDIEDDEFDEVTGEKGATRNQKIKAITNSQKDVVCDDKNYYYRYVKPPQCPTCPDCSDCAILNRGRGDHIECEGCDECTLKCFPVFDENGNVMEKCPGCEICTRKSKLRCHKHQECCKKLNRGPNRLRGLLPRILDGLLDARKAVRATAKNYPKGHVMHAVIEARQLGLKVTANSLYGFLGAAKMGKRPLMEASTSVTANGRTLTNWSADFCRVKHKLNVVYGDTDSIMVDITPLANSKADFNRIGRALAAEISKYFPPPLNLELEKVMKGIYICKKKYVGYVYKDDGTYKLGPDGKPELLIRGIILARRDNAKFLRTIYEHIIRMILDEATLLETMTYLVDNIKKLLAGEVHYEDLIVVRSIGAYYKSPTYFMKLFADNLARKGKPAKPGERLGYLITEATTEEQEAYLGNRMILPEEYIESQYTTSPYKIDYMYYLERQFQQALDQIIGAGYNRIFDKYESIKYRPSRRCKFTQIGEPVKMIVRMIKNGQSIDKLIDSIKAIDNNDPRGPVLQEAYENNFFEYPGEVRPLKPRRIIKVEEPIAAASSSGSSERPSGPFGPRHTVIIRRNSSTNCKPVTVSIPTKSNDKGKKRTVKIVCQAGSSGPRQFM